MVTAEEVAHELTGSCKSLYEVLEFHGCEHLELDYDFCDALDQKVFCCESCGWWSEISDMAENEADSWVCEECSVEA